MLKKNAKRDDIPKKRGKNVNRKGLKISKKTSKIKLKKLRKNEKKLLKARETSKKQGKNFYKINFRKIKKLQNIKNNIEKKITKK